jgi:hypothetical protein
MFLIKHNSFIGVITLMGVIMHRFANTLHDLAIPDA